MIAPRTRQVCFRYPIGVQRVPRGLSGQPANNKAAPFVIKAQPVNEPTRVSISAFIAAENGFKVSREVSRILYVLPALKVNSDTLAISHPDLYRGLGFAYDFFNDNGGLAWPPADYICKHKNLFVLDELETTAQMLDRLQPFLENGGNFFVHGYGLLSSYDASRFQTENDFFAKYLQVRYLGESEDATKVSGAEGDPISNGLEIELGKPRYNVKPGILEPLGSAVPIFRYPTGKVAGVRVDGKYKVVYLEFALQDISSLEIRKELVRRILAWFNGK